LPKKYNTYASRFDFSIVLKLTPLPPSHNPAIGAISLDHTDRIPETSMEDEHPTARSIYLSNIHRRVNIDLSPKALFQRLGMQGA
jgi:hypothetical protein